MAGTPAPRQALVSVRITGRTTSCLLPAHYTGADDRDRTGDLVLTKDVLCQLSYIGPMPVSQRSRVIPAVALADSVVTRIERELERETGIEPATNSLEGCDSTTELLPPPRPTRYASRRFGGQARAPYSRLPFPTDLLACQPKLRGMSRREAKAGGEGRIRTFEALGRQIYSLLRLTASLPRRTV